MSEKERPSNAACDAITASTLAAASIIEYFKKNNWQIVSFFPNSACAHKACIFEEKSSSKSRKKKK